MTTTKNKTPMKITKKPVDDLPFVPDPPRKYAPDVQAQKDKAAKSAPKAAKKSKVEDKGFRFDLLDNWMNLNAEVKHMSEEESFALIQEERKGKCRPNVILRLHGRFNKMRGLREKSEFMQSLNK